MTGVALSTSIRSDMRSISGSPAIDHCSLKAHPELAIVPAPGVAA